MKRIRRIKLPSIKHLITQSKESFFRFPLTILSSLVATCIGIYLVEFSDEIKNHFPLINLLLASALGISLYFCGSIFMEKNHYGIKSKLICALGVTILLALIYSSLPESREAFTNITPYIRYGIFVIIAHLFVSFIPYFKNKTIDGFWNYNEMLLLRFFTAALYSWVLYVGLILAMEALKLLFEINIKEEKLYPNFFIFTAGLFNTWGFASGIPKELNKLDSTQNHPLAIKVFVQYVLLPLLALYLIIVYAYGAKILFLWNWPKGIVAYLISGISILGIITFLLVYPYSQSKENAWIKIFTKNYFYILFPLIILLFIAIWLRINSYGTTINRYVIVVLGVWLSMVSFYFSIRKTNIKFIPISLSIILILILFGPWSMFSISEKSQVNRFKKILVDHSILMNDSISNEVVWMIDSLPKFYSKHENINERLFNDSIHNEIKSILDYLSRYHGLSKIKPLFQQNIDSLTLLSSGSDKHINRAKTYMNTLGLKYEQRILNDHRYFNYSSEIINRVTSVKKYDYFLKFNLYSHVQIPSIDSFKIGNIDYYMNQDSDGLIIASNNDTVRFKLDSLANELNNEFGNNNQQSIPKHKMVLKESSSTFDMKIEIHSLGMKKVNDTKINLDYISGYLFLKKK